MYKLVAIWSAPRPEDVADFEKHYEEVHAPAALAVPGMVELVTTRTSAGLEGSEPGFHRVAEMVFASAAALADSEHSEEWAALRADAGGMIERFGVTLTVGLGEATRTPGLGAR